MEQLYVEVHFNVQEQFDVEEQFGVEEQALCAVLFGGHV